MWTQFGRLRLYPNIFAFLVGPPGTGKTVALNPMSDLLRKAGSVTLAPNDVTKQGLLDALGKASKGALIPQPDGTSRAFDYHFLALHVAELSNFMSQYDHAMAGLLTELFDCPSFNDEQKRSHDKGKFIPFPGISMIVGTATQNLGNTIADEMWGSGFMARVIMVYSAEDVRPDDRFAIPEDLSELETSLVGSMRSLGSYVGEMQWSTEAQVLLNSFSQHQEQGAPLHNRLTHYVKRRWLHLGKLCMIAALSDELMVVTAAHFHTAMGWLLEAEAHMTEVFKDLKSHEDGEVLAELRFTFYTAWLKRRGPIPRGLLVEWLMKRVAAYTVDRMIELACAAGYIVRVAGTTGETAEYVPTAPDGFKPTDTL